jgi:SAM-dependent methyltransferase
MPSAIQLFHVWDTYERVIGGNHMFHRELGAGVRELLAERFASRPFSVLDLGCGDAATLAGILRGSTVARYRGADLSEAALAVASRNLAALACPLELHHGDMCAEIAAPGLAFDLIHSSYALHHVDLERKRAFFRDAAARLAVGGVFALVDLVREEGQGLDAYREAYTAWVRRTMHALAPAEHDAVCAHVAQFDSPEPWSVLEELAAAAGLRRVSEVTPHPWHRLMVFEAR